MKRLLISCILLHAGYLSISQSVGVGTATPHASSILELNSLNKGLLLPRVNDTINIVNPAEGLFIYNLATRSPNYYNGNAWIAMTSQVTPGNPDSIACIASSNYGTFNAQTFSQAISSNGSTLTKQDIFVTKFFDVASVTLQKTVFTSAVTANIEFKFFKFGQTTPYYSVKIYNVTVSSGQTNVSTTDGFTEAYSFKYNKIGFKDWASGQSWGWDFTTNALTTY